MLKLIVVLIVAGVIAQDEFFEDKEQLIPNFKNPAPLPDTFFDEDLADEMEEMKSCGTHTTRRTTRETTITTPYTTTTERTTTTGSETTDRTTTSSTPTGDFCVTPTCIKSAADLIRSMNTTVDPCDDFYEYACGSWAKHNFIPWGKGEYGTFMKLGDDVFYKTMDLMQVRELRTDPLAVKKVKRSFQSCMDTALIDTLEGRPLTDLLTKLGGFPVLERRYDASRFNYLDLMVKMNTMGFQILFQHGVWNGYRDPKNYYFQLDEALLNMKERDYYMKPEHDSKMALYRTFALEMALELGAPNSADTEKQMNDMIDFEVELAKINAPASERKDWSKIYRKYTLDEFSRQVTNGIDMRTYINGLMRANGRRSVDSNFKLINWSTPKFFRAFVALINRTPKKTVANYMMFNFVYNTCGYLSPKKFGRIISRFVNPIWGAGGNYARANTCSWTVGQGMGWATGRMFVDGFFDRSAKSAASEMIDSIRKTFQGMMQKLTWMDASSRNTAVAKAEAITKMIGYPDEIVDDAKLNKIYERMVMKKDTYYNNYLSLWASQAHDNYMNIGTPVNKHDYTSWIVMPTVVNAFYSPTANSISFPAAILQPPFYHKDHPKYLNYAGIGYVMGHELTHGFDNSGKEYDLNGNHRQWWPADVIAKYKRKAQCFIDQYSNYYVPEVKRYVNGALTLNENLADNGGILESFKAYRKFVNTKLSGREEPALPGMGLTNDQTFYLNAAQVWCGKVFTERAWDWDLKEVHSPGRYRVWGSVSNSEDFAKTFKCPRGSKMNPSKKCALWV